MRFSKDYLHQQCPNFTHLLENLSMFQALKIEPNLPIQYYVQCSHWAFIWSIYWCAINRIKRLCWIVWWNNKYHFIYFSTSSVFYKDLNIKHPISTQQHVEKLLLICLKTKRFYYHLLHLFYYTLDNGCIR